MTLPVNNTSNVADDDSDIFGPPHTSPPIRRNRPKVPMISAQLRMREVRKRILQLCVHKLERIKDSERNLRRSVCINNTYCRLTDDIRREKQNKYLALNQLVKSEADMKNNNSANNNNNNSVNNKNNENLNNSNYQHKNESKNNDSNSFSNNAVSKTPKRTTSVETDLETLDRELCALDAAMPLVDPEITQNAEKLEQAMVSRKRKFSQMDDDDNDRLVREALSQFYLPNHRPLTGIDDYPSHLLGPSITSSVPVTLSPSIDIKRTKVDLLDGSSHHHHNHHQHNHHPFHSLPDLNAALELSNQNHHHHLNHQKDFEVIMDALRIGAATGNTMTGTATNGCSMGLGNIDSCGQAAMMMAGETGSVFHNLVVTSLET